MTTPTIEFATPTELAELCASPWNATGKSAYKDLILKPEYSNIRYRIPGGESYLRIVPALLGSRGCMLDIYALKYPGGRHIHIKTLQPGEKSVFDRAYQWFSLNRPEALYSRSNKLAGYRFLTDPFVLLWVLVQEGSKIRCRLVLESKYDGSRGGAPSIGYQIWKLAQQERDENGDLTADPVDIVHGVQICIQKTQPTGVRFPSYSVRLGRVPAPMRGILDRMEPAEIATLSPLINVVHLPSEEEEWSILERIIGTETVTNIREAN